ncbi:MAG: hypothetical protein ABSG62_06685 [Terracidiphilus sp.]
MAGVPYNHIGVVIAADGILAIVEWYSLTRLRREIDSMVSVLPPVEVSCAVEVFLAIASLHKEYPGRPEFTIQEVLERAAKENITGDLRPGVHVHASQHCVANKAPNPAKHRMLFATGKHTRRLLLPGDEIHPERTGKIFPEPGEVPEKYLPLLEWARERYEKARPAAGIWADDPDERVRQLRDNSYAPLACFGEEEEPRPRHLEGLLQARGIGAEMAKGIDPDDYIRELREGWE